MLPAFSAFPKPLSIECTEPLGASVFLQMPLGDDDNPVILFWISPESFVRICRLIPLPIYLVSRIISVEIILELIDFVSLTWVWFQVMNLGGRHTFLKTASYKAGWTGIWRNYCKKYFCLSRVWIGIGAFPVDTFPNGKKVFPKKWKQFWSVWESAPFMRKSLCICWNSMRIGCQSGECVWFDGGTMPFAVPYMAGIE